jgi:hypothetical protein
MVSSQRAHSPRQTNAGGFAEIHQSRTYQVPHCAKRLSVMDPTKIRMRYLAGILVAAVIVAAVLRHTLHVHAGFTRQEIAILALAALAAVLTAVLIRRRRRD